MRVKLFSHVADPDGIGCVILASLVYLSLDVTLCKDPNELNEVLEQFLKEESSYDLVYITDLCPKDEYVKLLKEKFRNVMIFDHHLTSKKQLKEDYPFVISMEKKDGKSICATSLFYQYLREQHLLKENVYLDTFVEYTRLHDTYDWAKENNLDAYDLQTLFQYLGWNGYYHHFKEKCLLGEVFTYSEEEQSWLCLQKKKNRLAVECLLRHLIIKKYQNITYGAVIGEYEYRNLLADEVEKMYPDVDVVMLLAYNNESVSFRSIKEVPVEPLAREYGGGGHLKAASCKLTPENEQKLIKKFILK